MSLFVDHALVMSLFSAVTMVSRSLPLNPFLNFQNKISIACTADVSSDKHNM